MTEAQAKRQAAKQSKAEGPAFVVWVPDEGRAVWDGSQLQTWGALVFLEAAFVAGVQVSTETVGV